jgi:hypothetical protein
VNPRRSDRDFRSVRTATNRLSHGTALCESNRASHCGFVLFNVVFHDKALRRISGRTKEEATERLKHYVTLSNESYTLKYSQDIIRLIKSCPNVRYYPGISGVTEESHVNLR